MSFEQLVELLAQARRIWATSNSHAEVNKAKREERKLLKLAMQKGYDMVELRKRERSRYLDLVYA